MNSTNQQLLTQTGIIKKVSTVLSFSLVIFLFLSSCQSSDSSGKKELGEVKLQVTGNVAAQQHFEEGLLYLHSFEYLDAMSSFIRAQKADPECGMAYWGEAMAYYHPLFNKELTSMAQRLLTKMGTTKSIRAKRFKTEIEKDMWESIEILFGSGSESSRNKAYSTHYQKLYKKYPGNHEIASFYALSLLKTPKALTNNKKNYEIAGEINSDILKSNPKHPGALHYLIHAYDSPSHAHLALDAANKYASIAKDAGHALHMPSHIYLALGKWNKVVNSNIDSWNAGVLIKKKYPRNQDLGYHSLSWLHYGLLQRGENEMANNVLNEMVKYSKTYSDIMARTYMVAMRSTHMSETDTWTGPIADLNIKTVDLHLTKQVGNAYANGMQAFHKKDKSKLQKIIKEIGVKKELARMNLSTEYASMCNTAGNPRIPPNQLDIDIVSVIEKELQAALFELEGKNDKALIALEEGVAIFEKLAMAQGPPIIIKPIQEAYTAALIKNKQYDKALVTINKCLKSHPERLQSLKLKKQILDNFNNTEEAKQTLVSIESNMSNQPRKPLTAYMVK